ncbi:hypothetical protein [Fodinicola feengrottensis]|uniref:hypothetical protein n=1 Tax=Fodinicola feengrottensis TaxID=435914 RepID=UPI0013D078B3|nr:hypothetical protein [Fodinicola feengrottensis]
MGKTSLAVHLAQRLAGRFPDAQLYLDLHAHTAGTRPMSPTAALDKLLRALDIPGERIPADLDDRAGLWRAEVARRRAVLVLDNAADAGQVRPLLPGAAGSFVLITARRRLVGLEAADSFSPLMCCQAVTRSRFSRRSWARTGPAPSRPPPRR